jgi:hypothetical protein
MQLAEGGDLRTNLLHYPAALGFAHEFAGALQQKEVGRVTSAQRPSWPFTALDALPEKRML